MHDAAANMKDAIHKTSKPMTSFFCTDHQLQTCLHKVFTDEDANPIEVILKEAPTLHPWCMGAFLNASRFRLNLRPWASHMSRASLLSWQGGTITIWWWRVSTPLDLHCHPSRRRTVLSVQTFSLKISSACSSSLKGFFKVWGSNTGIFQ